MFGVGTSNKINAPIFSSFRDPYLQITDKNTKTFSHFFTILTVFEESDYNHEIFDDYFGTNSDK